MTTPAQFRRIEELFHRTVELPADQRAVLLDACDDPEVRREVERMLAEDDHGTSTEHSRDRLGLKLDRTPKDRPGESIGPYRLVKEIGEGGMGVVWVAEQRAPVQRRVALKLIKWGMDTRQVVARFESERQALALMDHPNIARVFDAGATDAGRPYFVMELVPGRPITTYCEAQGLDTDERLGLFARVCDAVQHAHQKGIIHRDLKPSNILVSTQGGEHVPKVIDFGVVKATAQRLTEKTVFTELGQLIGTPEYMSPEQADAGGTDVDTRSDVYSLGVLLYELLAGVLPLDSRELRAAGYLEILERIRTSEPSRPSTRVSADRSAALRGDLDWITMRAMAKEPDRRYPSVSELASDIRRHLADQPVSAGPPDLRYRVRKFLRRHRIAVGVAGLALVLLLLGTGGTTLGMLRALAAEHSARLEAERAEAVSDFLVDLFEVSRPSESLGNTITAREILDRGAARIRDELDVEPIVQARLMYTMGAVYTSLGLYDEALPLAEEALGRRTELLGEADLEVAQSRRSVGRIHRLKGDYDRARREVEKAVVLLEEELGSDHLDLAQPLYELAAIHLRSGRAEEAKRLFERSLAIRELHLDPVDPEIAQGLHGVAMAHNDLGAYERARELYERSIAIREQALGPEHPSLPGSLNNLAVVHWYLGNLDAAAELYRRAWKIREKMLGPDHPDVAYPIENLAIVHAQQGEFDVARELLGRALEIRTTAYGPVHRTIASIHSNLGSMLADSGKPEEARIEFERAIDNFERALGSDHPRVAYPLTSLGKLLVEQGQYAEARPLLQRALALREAGLAPGHPQLAYPLVPLAEIAAAEGDRELARELFERALAIREAKLPADHPDHLETLEKYEAFLRSIGEAGR